MKPVFSRMGMVALAGVFTLLALGRAHGQDDIFDSVDDMLKFSAINGNVNGRVSGLLDMEGYYMQQPAPGLIETNHPFLFNPRLTVFLDAQLGQQFYFFAQARADRGFDPADAAAQIRLDEYAMRYTPWSDGRFNLQLGKFATVVGNWTDRHDSWENPFITAPLPYENTTSLWDSAGANSWGTVLDWSNYAKYPRIPVIWGPSYAMGAAVSGRIGKFDYAGEVKNGALSSRPEEWDATEGFEHPTFSGRIGYRPDEAWNLGVSASMGSYLMPQAAPTLAPGYGLGDYRSILFGQDASYAWHHWELWAEVFESRFEIPDVGNADSLAYYIEAKYKFTPQLFGALRWNQQLFNKVPDDDGDGETYPWTDDQWRIDAALTYRLTPHMQAKLQYSLMQLDDGDSTACQQFVAIQFTLRF